MEWRRLDLGRIEEALRVLLRLPDMTERWQRLREEPLTDDATRRLIEGYRYVDQLLAERIDIFAYGQSGKILELNHRVLCGVSSERRASFQSHLAATERHFYDDPLGGISALSERYSRWQRHAPETLAAEIYVQAVSAPQLFLEGNSRTAALIASYCLARAGLPPLVVTVGRLDEYHGLAERIAALSRDGITGMLTFGICARRMTQFIRESADPAFLTPRPVSARVV